MPIDQTPTIPPSSLPSPGPTAVATILGYHGELVRVTTSGEVLISWKNVEAYASDPQSDWKMLAYARMLLAARDGTWKPLPDNAR